LPGAAAGFSLSLMHSTSKAADYYA